MKKSLRERLNASLDKALDPPRKRPKQDLDALLEEYNDGQSTAVRRETAQESSEGIPAGIPSGIPSGIPDAIPAGIPNTPPDKSPQESRKDAAVSKRQQRAAVAKQEEADEAGAEIFVSVDATHTASEKIVYSHMYRETVSKGRQEGHFGPALLMKLSGIRSRNTVHKALYGLIEKLSVEKVAEASGHPLGPRYRVYGPQEILRRRKGVGMVIDTETKKITEKGNIPASIPVGIPTGIPRYPKNWDTPLPEIGIVGIPNFGILLNRENITDAESSAGGSSSNKFAAGDDEAFAGFVALMRKAAEEVTGRAPTAAEKSRWTDLAELLSAELKIAAGRTTVSSAPAFLTEHLRRRLWKKDLQQVVAEDAQQGPATARKADISQCPDCFGTGMFYPDGYDKGVAKCGHERLPSDAATADAPEAAE